MFEHIRRIVWHQTKLTVEKFLGPYREFPTQSAVEFRMRNDVLEPDVIDLARVFWSQRIELIVGCVHKILGNVEIQRVVQKLGPKQTCLVCYEWIRVAYGQGWKFNFVQSYLINNSYKYILNLLFSFETC